jgi:hypothetical protein
MNVFKPLASKIKQKFLLEVRKKKYEINGHYKRIEDIDLSPVFVLGGNRSGTSLISSLLGQHPQLEGIFSKFNEPSRKDERNHFMAYCTSHHVWNFLDRHWVQKNKDELPLWGHPKHISRLYRDKPKDEKEALLLANLLRSYIKTDKTPLVNSHFNMFRIGLITKIFPHAKFVLIIRDYQDHIRSCIHKWSEWNIEYPKIGLHWLTLNSCCIYDLKKYASGNFAILDYSSMFQDQKTTNRMFNEKLRTIGLDEFDYDLNVVSTKHRYLGKEHITHLKFDEFFGCIDSLLSFEQTLIED